MKFIDVLNKIQAEKKDVKYPKYEAVTGVAVTMPVKNIYLHNKIIEWSKK